MSQSATEPPRSMRSRVAVWLATGLGLGLVAPAPGTFGAAVWGLPLAWAIGRLPQFGWQLAAIVTVNLVGVPLATVAGRALGNQKDNQAIIWDEIATMPIVFLLVPLANWRIAVAGFALHRFFDITKPPPASQLERLPEGLGVAADDVAAAVYACLVLGGLAWLNDRYGWAILAMVVGG